MNRAPLQDPWQRLVAAARRAGDPRDDSAPLGFATRIAAQALSATPRISIGSIFERLSLRALIVACLLMLISFAINYSAISHAFEDEIDVNDPVAEVLVLAS